LLSFKKIDGSLRYSKCPPLAINCSPKFSQQPHSLSYITGSNIMPLSITSSPLEFCLLKFYKHFSSLRACYTLTQFHTPLFNHRNNNYWVKPVDYEVLHYIIFSAILLYFLLIKSKYSPEYSVLELRQSMLFPQSTRQIIAPILNNALNNPPSFMNFHNILLISLIYFFFWRYSLNLDLGLPP
jgi:hypothetical protein